MKLMDKRYNLASYQASFGDFLLAGNISPLSKKNYLSDLRHFTQWYRIESIRNHQDENQLQEAIRQDSAYIYTYIDSEAIETYVNYLKIGTIPRKTINRRLSTLRKFFDFSIQEGLVTVNPTREIANIKPTANHDKSIDSFLQRLKSDMIGRHEAASDIEEFLQGMREV